MELLKEINAVLFRVDYNRHILKYTLNVVVVVCIPILLVKSIGVLTVAKDGCGQHMGSFLLVARSNESNDNLYVLLPI